MTTQAIVTEHTCGWHLRPGLGYMPDNEDCPTCCALAADAARDDVLLVLPPHLRADAPFQRCSGCGRKTWDAAGFGQRCQMPQPSGNLCAGWFVPERPTTDAETVTADVDAKTAEAAEL